MECPHLERVCGRGQPAAFPATTHIQEDYRCAECGDTSSVWICVTCGALNCGRYVSAHGLKHREKTKGHSTCMETRELSVYCYDCDEFVINDTADRYLEGLRTLLLKKNLSQEEGSPAAGRSLRARRKRPLSVSVATAAPGPESPGARLKVSKKENKKENKNENKTKPPPRKRLGLKNLGNTCFMNSVLQSLSNIEEFCNVLTTLPSLDREQTKGTKETKKPGPVNGVKAVTDGIILTEELKKVLVALVQGDEKTAISPDSLFQAIWKVVPRFRGYQQQDAHEFLRYMLDRLHTELLHLLPAHRLAQQSWADDLRPPPRTPSAQSQSLVTSVFGGSLQSCVTCLTCQTSSKKLDPFLDLSIDIPQAHQGPVRKAKDGEKPPACHIYDCLQKFVEREELADSERFFCSTCKSKQPSTKQFRIRRLPTVLCLHVKRFRWTAYARSKLDTFIEFPLAGLDMSSYLLNNLNGTRFSNAGSSLYDLAAVIVHHGTGAGSGHYTAFATNNKAWFNFNDCSVKETDFQTVNSCKAYILFYVQRDF